jgi:hypothetical protein
MHAKIDKKLLFLLIESTKVAHNTVITFYTLNCALSFIREMFQVNWRHGLCIFYLSCKSDSKIICVHFLGVKRSIFSIWNSSFTSLYLVKLLTGGGGHSAQPLSGMPSSANRQGSVTSRGMSVWAWRNVHRVHCWSVRYLLLNGSILLCHGRNMHLNHSISKSKILSNLCMRTERVRRCTADAHITQINVQFILLQIYCWETNHVALLHIKVVLSLQKGSCSCAQLQVLT